MSLFTLTEQDMIRRPALWTFAYDGLPYQQSRGRTWGQVLRIRRFNLWLILTANTALIGALDGTVVFLVISARNQSAWPILLLSGVGLLLTMVYVPSGVKLLNYLRGGGYRG